MRGLRVDRKKIVRPPIHPGEILGKDVLPALNITISDAAERLGVSRQTLHRIIAGRAGISAEMAVRLGKFCGNGPEVWLRMQENYDLWHARRRLEKEINRIPTMQA